MAGSIAQTTTVPPEDRSLNRIVLGWTSDASGNVNGIATTVTVNGTICKVEFKPDAGGTQPSNAYDVTLLDTAGVDVLAGQGANLSNAAASAVCPGIALKDGTTTSVVPCMVRDPLTLNVSGAGNSKGGQVILYVR